MIKIKESTFNFLSDLSANNNRIWFSDNKPRYQDAHENIKAFLTALEEEMNKIDEIEKSKLFRIYRDVRFSKDKTPYKSYFSLTLGRRKPYLRGGYYLMMGPSNSHLGCGFWNPDSTDLRLIRDHIAQDDKPFRKVLASKQFKDSFGKLEGETVKTSPKGFSKDHKAIDLIKHKQFLVSKSYTDREVLSNDFLMKVVHDFGAVRPFFNYMSEILGHDLNGVPLY